MKKHEDDPKEVENEKFRKKPTEQPSKQDPRKNPKPGYDEKNPGDI